MIKKGKKLACVISGVDSDNPEAKFYRKKRAPKLEYQRKNNDKKNQMSYEQEIS